jgi:hypothetical protein
MVGHHAATPCEPPAQAMRESFGGPEDDRFMLIEEYDKQF